MENILKVLLNRLWKALDLPTCSCRGTILIEKPLSIVVVPLPKSYLVKITFQIFEIRCENLFVRPKLSHARKVPPLHPSKELIYP